MKSDLAKLWKQSLECVQPRALLTEAMLGSRVPTAFLCWGKAALSTWKRIEGFGGRDGEFKRLPGLIVSPRLSMSTQALRSERTPHSNCRWVEGDHPLPGEGSFAAGEAILDFFDSLRRYRVRRLAVFLSGGASSLAWVPPAGMGVEELHGRLRSLYARPLPIADLNSARSALCALKAGGSARWLNRLAPEVRARVEVISDVEPYGPSVVGSGPFWVDAKIPHRVLAGNSTWVGGLARECRNAGFRVLLAESGKLGGWEDWVSGISTRARDALSRGELGAMIFGGEPSVRIPAGIARRAERRGGRQSQIAAGLALELFEELLDGRIELLCASSDGVDGKSGSAGSVVDRAILSKLGEHARKRLKQALRRFETGALFGGAGALLPEELTGTNVQDAVLVILR